MLNLLERETEETEETEKIVKGNTVLLLPSGGYTRLKSFQLARLVYDVTIRFVELYITPRSRTCDQMIQAARSGVQNIAEGSIDAATSAKIEKRQIDSKMQRFELSGGFSEHLHKIRKNNMGQSVQEIRP